jgi:hypothetical protein
LRKSYTSHIPAFFLLAGYPMLDPGSGPHRRDATRPAWFGLLWGAATVAMVAVLGYGLLDRVSRSPRPALSAPRASVQGVVSVEPPLQPRPGDYVFLSLRPAGRPTAPPLAVQKLPAASLPAAFELGAGDSMLGRPWPAHLEIEAHLDADGDPLTHSGTEPSARLSDVTTGARGLRLVLRGGDGRRSSEPLGVAGGEQPRQTPGVQEEQRAIGTDPTTAK